MSSSQAIICVPTQTHRVFCRTHRVWRRTHRVLSSKTVLLKQYSAHVPKLQERLFVDGVFGPLVS